MTEIRIPEQRPELSEVEYQKSLERHRESVRGLHNGNETDIKAHFVLEGILTRNGVSNKQAMYSALEIIFGLPEWGLKIVPFGIGDET